MLTAYQAAWVRKGQRPRTVHSRMAIIQRFYRWALVEHLIDNDPSRHLVIPRSPNRSSQLILTRAEIARLIAASDTMGPPWPLAVRLLALTGLRLGELLEARHRDLIDHDGSLVLRIPHRKMRDAHHLVIPTTCRPLIPADRPASEHLVAHEGQGYRPQTFYSGLDVLSGRAGVDPPARPHRFRASLVSHARDAGIPDRDITATIGTTEAMASYYDLTHGARERSVGERMDTLYGGA